jgi:hypothetical protein
MASGWRAMGHAITCVHFWTPFQVHRYLDHSSLPTLARW